MEGVLEENVFVSELLREELDSEGLDIVGASWCAAILLLPFGLLVAIT